MLKSYFAVIVAAVGLLGSSGAAQSGPYPFGDEPYRLDWYYEPEIKRGPSPFGGDRMVSQITHMTVDGKTKKWVRRKIWGGTVVENVTQAVAADLLMAAIHRIDETGRYVTVLSVHDEVVAEGSANFQ